MSILVDFRRRSLLAKARILLAKGERVGHPFRGNQYRAGVHGGHGEVISDRPYHKPLVSTETDLDSDWEMQKVHERRDKGDQGNKEDVTAHIARDLEHTPEIQASLEVYGKRFVTEDLHQYLIHNVQEVINHGVDTDRENFAKAIGITVADLDKAKSGNDWMDEADNPAALSHAIALKLAGKIVNDPEFVKKYTEPERSNAGHWEYHSVESNKDRTWIDDPRPADHIGIDVHGLQSAITHATEWTADVTYKALDQDYVSSIIMGKNQEADRWSVVGARLMAQDSVNNWAGTSSDASMKSIAMQMAIARHFDLGDDHLILQPGVRTEGWGQTERKERALKEAKAELDEYGKVYDRVVSSIYNRTQAVLAMEGREGATLFRGTTTQEAATYGTDKTVKLSPLSAWSYMRQDGTDFAGMRAPETKDQRLLVATVPRERIFSTALTGLGCTREHEVVVLGGKAPDKVTIMRRTTTDDESPLSKPWTAEKPPLYSPAQKTDRKLEEWYGVDKLPGMHQSVETKHQAALAMLGHGDMNLKEYTQWFNYAMPGTMQSSKWKQGLFDQAKETAHKYQEYISGNKPPSYESQAFSLGHATAKDVEAMVTLPHADGKTPKTISEKHYQAIKLIEQGKMSAAEHSSWIDDHGAQEGLTPSQIDSYKLAAWLSESTKSEGLEAG